MEGKPDDSDDSTDGSVTAAHEDEFKKYGCTPCPSPTLSENINHTSAVVAWGGDPEGSEEGVASRSPASGSHQRGRAEASKPRLPNLSIPGPALPTQPVEKNRHYVVVKGLEVGIFDDWCGVCHASVLS